QILEILNTQYGLRTRPGNVRGGKPLSKAGIYRIFSSTYYYGYFYRNGVLYKGSYKPMITVEEFDQIQIILGRKGKPRPKRHTFAYTGLMKCGVCGSSITATEKQKLIKATGLMKTYIMYHCTHRKKDAINCTERNFLSVQTLEKMIIEELARYQVRPVFKDWALSIARENYQGESEKHQMLIAAEQNNEKRLRQELNNLIDLRISNGISEEVFFQKKAEKEELLIRIQSKKSKLESQSCNWTRTIEDKFNYMVDIVERFKNSDENSKKELCHDFGSNWILKDKKLFISKHEWLESFKKYKDGVETILEQFEPGKVLENKGQNPSFEPIRPLVCDLVDEVRTRITPSSDLSSLNPP
ncbi:MAG: zinc ribbon domain-containing protein, partial [Bacteroidota bacterium]